MKTLLTAGACAVAALWGPWPLDAAAQAAGPATLILAQSQIVFVSRQMGVPVEGTFRRFDAQIALDPRKPETGKASFGIDMGSATLGIADTDAELARSAWFDVARFPRATFQSSAIRALGAGKFEVVGKLDLKGRVQDMVVPVLIAQSGAHSAAIGSFTLRRLDYKIGEGEWADASLVANDVQVKFKLALTGMAPL